MSAETLEQQLTAVKSEAAKEIDLARSSAELEDLRQRFLGSKSDLKAVLNQLRSLPVDDKKRIGQLANRLQQELEECMKSRLKSLAAGELAERLSKESLDVTLPGSGRRTGHIHPLSQITSDVVEILHGMGFTLVDGPEIETDYYNFDALNTPGDHPARDEQDTFYTDIAPHVLLRSQTSTMQIRAMEQTKPPLRICVVGRVYRNEEVNARKYPLFHQVEGLLIDRHVTMGHLKGTLNEFCRLLFGKELKTRFRPDYFPFTEPSAELDCQCPFCMGEGCRTCGNRGWLELLGCGMVDPNVLSGVGIDTSVWSGFAFGMGLDRLCMLKYGINDIRHLFTSDLRFLEQF